MKTVWLIVGVGVVAMAAFGFWLRNEHKPVCESCIAAEEPFFQIFVSPTDVPAARLVKIQSLAKINYSNFRVAITDEEAQIAEVKELIDADPVRFVKLPRFSSTQELMHQWVRSIPESDIAVIIPSGGSFDHDALENLKNFYSNPNPGFTLFDGISSGCVSTYQKMDVQTLASLQETLPNFPSRQ